MPTETDQQPSPRRIAWLDLTDLVEFFREYSSVTGIQRVVSMIVLALDSAPNSPDDAIEIRFCSYEFATARYHELDLDRLKDALSHILAGRAGGPSIADSIGPPAAFQPNDTFLVLGAFWFRASYCSIIIQTCASARLRLAVMCHDLIPIRYLRWFSAGYVDQLSRIWNAMFARAQLILTNSAHSARDVEDYCRNRGLLFHAPQILRLGDGIVSSDIPSAVQSDRVDRYLKYGFVLMVGSVGARKNQALLIDVWARLLRSYGEKTPYLVLIGKHSPPHIDDITLRSMNANDRIVHLDDVNDSELVTFYRKCLFTVFPSMAEGWGLPVAESLAAGKLCLASNATAIPEIGGALLEYFDPANADECYRKIEHYLFDPKLRERAEARIRTGYRGTSWKQCARQLRAILARFSAAVPGRRTPA